MGTFDVALPANKKIIFPAICVGCEKPDPDSFITISVVGATTTPILETVADSVIGYSGASSSGGNTTHHINGVPACKSCVTGLKWYHRIYTFFLYTAWLPGVLLICLQATPLWFSITFMLICICAAPVLSMIFPPAFGATFLNNNANFEFKRENVAKEFMKLNGVEAEKIEAA
jgi:hypothetical protein